MPGYGGTGSPRQMTAPGGGPQPVPGWPEDTGPQEPARGGRRGAGRRRDSGARYAAHGQDEDDGGFLPYDDDYDDEDEADEPRPRKRRRSRWVAPLVALLVILIPLGGLGYYGFDFYMNKYHPADYSGAGTGSVTVHVAAGSTATSLAPELQTLGVVASSRAFILAAENYKGKGTLEVGYYKLRTHMRASQAYAILTDPANIVQTTVRFPEGLRTATVVSLLGQHTALSLSSYQAAIKDVAVLGLPSYARGKPEGYLFPATYEVTPNETAPQVLKAMVNKYNQEAATLRLTADAARVGLTPGQVIVVASLVQAEGGRVSDFPKIARVVYNRLHAGMKLQFDSTVFYGLGKFGTSATLAEIHENTPYNTYIHTGLPPTPIDNPGAAAIQAALNPATGNWLYFLSQKNGSTKFSATPLG